MLLMNCKSDCNTSQSYNVVLESPSVRGLDVHQCEPYPTVLIDAAFAMDSPAKTLWQRLTHAGNCSRKHRLSRQRPHVSARRGTRHLSEDLSSRTTTCYPIVLIRINIA